MSEKNIHDYAEEQKQLNKEEEINIQLLQKIGVPIIPYGQSTYKGDSFPNCVENTILQLLKIDHPDTCKLLNIVESLKITSCRSYLI
jgi:hypothetical protein